jgi:hypothetical protein
MFEVVVEVLIKISTEKPSGGRGAATPLALLMSTLTTRIIRFVTGLVGAIVSFDVKSFFLSDRVCECVCENQTRKS